MGHRYLNGRVNTAREVSISCKNFVNFGPVTPEKTGLICILFLRHGKKLAYLVKYLRIYWTDIHNLSPCESALSADDTPVPCFPICGGTLPWQSIVFGKIS